MPTFDPTVSSSGTVLAVYTFDLIVSFKMTTIFDMILHDSVLMGVVWPGTVYMILWALWLVTAHGEHGRHGLGRGDEVDEVVFEIVAGLVLRRPLFRNFA